MLQLVVSTVRVHHSTSEALQDKFTQNDNFVNPGSEIWQSMSQLIAAATISSKFSTDSDYNPSGCSNASYGGATHRGSMVPFGNRFLNYDKLISPEEVVSHMVKVFRVM
jgi:hypothetical protein